MLRTLNTLRAGPAGGINLGGCGGENEKRDQTGKERRGDGETPRAGGWAREEGRGGGKGSKKEGGGGRDGGSQAREETSGEERRDEERRF